MTAAAVAKEGDGKEGKGRCTMEEGSDGGRNEGTDCSRLGSKKWFSFQALTKSHRSHRRHVPAANILIEGRRFPEHCASHTQTNTHKSVRKRKVSMEVIVMVVIIESRDVEEDVEARSTERGRKDGKKEGGVKVQAREHLALRRL